MVHEAFPSDEIDHINRVKTDNRIVNLRCVPRYINARNSRRPLGRSGFRGTRLNHAGRWDAFVAGKHLGSFGSQDEAIAYRVAADHRLGYI
jgi:hypothetical protein